MIVIGGRSCLKEALCWALFVERVFECVPSDCSRGNVCFGVIRLIHNAREHGVPYPSNKHNVTSVFPRVSACERAKSLHGFLLERLRKLAVGNNFPIHQHCIPRNHFEHASAFE